MQNKNDNNGHTAVEIELCKINMDKKIFQKVAKLIDEFKSDTHQTLIRDILENDAAAVFRTDIKGKNIFHIIATQPERNADILCAFGIDNEGNSAGLDKYVSKQRVEELLCMQSGSKKRCPIHFAVENGFHQFVTQMVKICPSLVSIEDGESNTPIHLAAMSSMPEAMECMKSILNVLEKSQLVDDILSKENANGRTPAHLVCSRIPKNNDSLVAAKLQKMLSYECSKNILKSVDRSGYTPLHLLCNVTDQCKDADRIKNVQDLMQILIRAGVDVNQPTDNKDKLTALHLLVKSEFPELIRILIAQHETNVLIKDAVGRMAIHYASERALRPKSQECVKILADWNLIRKNLATLNIESHDLFRSYLLWDAFTDEDGTKSTALTLACRSESTKTVEFILKNVYEAKSNFGIWFMSGNDKNQEVFSLKQVYKYTPAALEFLFDKSIHVDMENSNEKRVQLVTDISVITALARPIQEADSVSEMKYLGYANDWPEEVQEKLLLHPLTEFTLHALWQNLLPYKILWTILNILWLGAYWILVPQDYSDTKEKFPPSEIASAWILAVLTILYFFNEIFTFKTCVKRLFSCQMNDKLIWIQLILTLACIHGPCLQSVGLLSPSPPSDVEKLCASAGVLLSFILFWRNIGMIYLSLGIHVEYLIQTLKKILEAFICVVAIIIGFQRAFTQILPEQFPSAVWNFVKTLVMLTGEFEFGEMYEMYKNENGLIQNDTMSQTKWFGAPLIDFGTWNLLMFIMFLIILPITFYNLVTGVVVDKIKDMESRLEMYQILNQIRLINYIQQTIVSKLDYVAFCFKCLQPCFVSYRHTEDGEVIIDNELKWNVEKGEEPSLWLNVHHTFLQLFKCCGSAGAKTNVRSGEFLSKRVRYRMFEIYERQLQESQMQYNYADAGELEYI